MNDDTRYRTWPFDVRFAVIGALATCWIVVAGCTNGTPTGGETDTQASCVPGAVEQCVCEGGASGRQTCQSDGTFGACSCPDGMSPADTGQSPDTAPDPDTGTVERDTGGADLAETDTGTDTGVSDTDTGGVGTDAEGWTEFERAPDAEVTTTSR